MRKGVDTQELKQHCLLVVDAIKRGRVVPFLGAGVNLCDRPTPINEDADWKWDNSRSEFLPTGSELAEHLAREFYFPGASSCSTPGCHNPEHALDLARVSQYGDTALGGGRLREELRSIFIRDYPITSAHRFLASLPWPAPQAKRTEDRYPLIVTTNYDDLMEQALEDRNKPDLVYYRLPDDSNRAGFWHAAPGMKPVRIDDANKYSYRFFENHPVILKIHGTIDRANQGQEGYVITEDHYIEFLAEEALSNLLPATLLDKLRNSHLLFIGYSLKDWNLRVFLRRLKRDRNKVYSAWAVLRDADEEEQEFWSKHGVKIINRPLKQYIGELAKVLYDCP